MPAVLTGGMPPCQRAGEPIGAGRPHLPQRGWPAPRPWGGGGGGAGRASGARGALLGGHALPEGVPLVVIRAVLLGERLGIGLALGLAGLGGVDVGLDLSGDRLGGLGLRELGDALPEGVGAVLAGAVLGGERLGIGLALGLARL